MVAPCAGWDAVAASCAGWDAATLTACDGVLSVDCGLIKKGMEIPSALAAFTMPWVWGRCMCTWGEGVKEVGNGG